MAIDYWQKFQPNEKYHVYNRSINRTVLFKEKTNFHFFLKKWKLLISPFFYHGAYCLMPNHFHFLIWLKPINDELLTQVSNQKTVASRKYLKSQIDIIHF